MRIICFFMFLIFLVSCSRRKVDADIIPREKMGMILWDIIQADQFASQFLKKDSAKINVKEESMKMYDEIFQIHHITREQFRQSYDYYLNHPEITKTMLDSLAAEANRRRNEIYKRPILPPKLNPAMPPSAK